MNIFLAEKLINKNIIKIETEVDAYYEAISLNGTTKIKTAGTFSILRIAKNTNDNIIFELSSTYDGSKMILPVNAIFKIDGMLPEELAKAFDIKEDGTDQPIGKKRGRKPKDRTNGGNNQPIGQSSDQTQIRARRKGPNHRKFAELTP
jgi:hypothetical protein